VGRILYAIGVDRAITRVFVHLHMMEEACASKGTPLVDCYFAVPTVEHVMGKEKFAWLIHAVDMPFAFQPPPCVPIQHRLI
jgi:hypothetical protein